MTCSVRLVIEYGEHDGDVADATCPACGRGELAHEEVLYPSMTEDAAFDVLGRILERIVGGTRSIMPGDTVVFLDMRGKQTVAELIPNVNGVSFDGDTFTVWGGDRKRKGRREQFVIVESEGGHAHA